MRRMSINTFAADAFYQSPCKSLVYLKQGGEEFGAGERGRMIDLIAAVAAA